MKIATYGTLKEGNKNHHLLDKDPLFSGYVELQFEMFAHEYFPWLIPSNEKHSIYLEVYEVSDDKMELLDRIEGGAGYHRETIKLPMFDEQVYIYVGSNELEGEKVTDGNF